MTMNPEWQDVDDFYLADERREHSIEHTLPGVWYAEDWTAYRLYWLQATGEIVAIASSSVNTAHFAEPARTGRRTELIGWAETLAKAEKMLAGWSGQSGQIKGYYWLRRRAENADTPVTPGRLVTDEHRDRARAASGSLF